MSPIPVIAIFDVGKTNKKLFLFDENYQIVYEKTARFIETVDEEGDPCENLESLEQSVFDSLHEVFRKHEYEVKAVNFSTYGASFVHVGNNGRPVAPLYNYLKNYPNDLKEQFYNTYGGEEKLARETSSPVLGNLNSGMQLYRIKHQNPALFTQIKYSLHLPQYLSYLLTSQACTDITSIGCHTSLWSFENNDYHEWVYQEGLNEKFAPLIASDAVIKGNTQANHLPVGIGLHDSSAALIPYLVNFNEPFVLISTGTWCISLNPFNNCPLTAEDLLNDCLCYIQYKGLPVKASRLFAGNEHEIQTKRIAEYFNITTAVFKQVNYNAEIVKKLKQFTHYTQPSGQGYSSAFSSRDLSQFADYNEAYHQLIMDIMTQQYQSTQRVLQGTTAKRIFVDGGFSKNVVYMNLLAQSFPELEVFAASMAQATAVGTALAIHPYWNDKALPSDIIELKYYAAPHSNVF